MTLHRLPSAMARVAAALVLATIAAAPAAEPLTIVALGDSNTNGDGIVRASAWPAELERLLRAKGHEVRIANRGVSGDTTGAGLARLDSAVPDGSDAAIVFLGRNDRRVDVPEKTTRDNLDRILARLRGRGVDVLLVGFRPYDFSDIAERHGAGYYPDFFTGVTGKNGKKLLRYRLPLDPVGHLNPSGHAVVAKGLLPAAERLVRRTGG